MYYFSSVKQLSKKVSLAFKEGAFKNTEAALSSLDLKSIQNKSVLIKPNIGRCVKSGTGINTSPEAVAAVIETLLKAGACNIAIGESPILGVNIMEAFKKSGITDVAEKYGCRLIDFDSEKPVDTAIKNGRILKSTKICAPVFRYDILVSVAVSKIHMHTGVTLGIKNMKGCLYKREKVRYHQLEYEENKSYKEKTLDSAISDLASVLLPDITVIDGFIGMEGLGPSGGEAVKSNFALASFNPIAADIIGCVMMGQNPQDIPHLRIIAEKMKQSLNPDDYEVSPSDYQLHSTQYKKPPSDISIEHPDVVLCDKESCSACLSTVMLFLKRFKTDMSQYLLDDDKLHLAIGKGVTEKDIKTGTVLIGNCAKNLNPDYKFVPGCPPVPTRIYKTITGMEPEKNEP